MFLLPAPEAGLGRGRDKRPPFHETQKGRENMSWRLRVKDKFQAAHFLKEYQGKCEKVHGHTFQVEAVIEVAELDRTGIGIDFAEIKAKLAEVLPDHTLLNDVYPFNPSAENLVREFFSRLKKHLPVIEVTAWESEDACATYSEDH